MQLPSGKNPAKAVSQEIIYTRPYLRFVKNILELDGQLRDYSYAEINDGVGIVALNERGEVALVGQWRHPIQKYNWEIPAGMREKNEEPLQTAQRELQEEAGVSASKWEDFGSFLMESSSTVKQNFLFMAQDLQMGDQSLDEDERIEVVWMPLEEALAKTVTGEIKDGLTVLGLLKTQWFLQHHKAA